MPTQTFQVPSQLQLEVAIEFAEIVRDYGDGYDDNVLVGHSDGQLFYRLVWNSLPDRTTHTVTDEDAATVTWADYIWQFFINRKQDGEAFNITDPRSGSTVLVKFVERRLTYNMIHTSVFTTGILLRQHRA